MTGSVAIDIVLGLIFIYLLYSLLGSLLQEIIATNLGFRAKIQEKAIGRMLDDDSMSNNAWTDRRRTWARLLLGIGSLLKNKGFSSAFYQHPEIKFKGEDSWHKNPSSLEASSFSKVVVDLLRGTAFKVGDDPKKAIDAVLNEKGSGNWTAFKPSPAEGDHQSIDPNTLLYLKSLWADSQGDVEVFKTSLESWFDQMMLRTTGWYKKYSQVLLFVIGMFIAVGFNVDTLLIVEKLSNDPDLREQLVQQATAFVEAHPNLDEELARAKKEINYTDKQDSLTQLAEAEARYNLLKARQDSLLTKASELIEEDINKVSDLLGLGWDTSCTTEEDCDCLCLPRPKGSPSIPASLPGWILTALAISLGAPFWYDVLNKVMKLRASVQTVSRVASNPKEPKGETEKRVG